MKRTISCAVASLILMTGSAVADDPTVSRPWTGFYIGAGVGAGAVVMEQALNEVGIGTLFSDNASGQGFLATATVGYDFRVMQRVVAGAFLDYDWSSISADFSSFSPFFTSAEHQRSWALGARVGYLATPTTLWYLAGGYTRATVEIETLGGFDFEGYFLGGGVEARLAGGWSLRGEYRFTQFQSETVLQLCTCDRVDVETSTHTGRLMLIYRFANDELSLLQ